MPQCPKCETQVQRVRQPFVLCSEAGVQPVQCGWHAVLLTNETTRHQCQVFTELWNQTWLCSLLMRLLTVGAIVFIYASDMMNDTLTFATTAVLFALL